MTTSKPSRFVIPTGTDLTQDRDVLPAIRGRDFLSEKTPVWSTQVDQAVSGREYRKRNWSYPKWKFSLRHEVVFNPSGSASDLEKLFAFYNLHGGSYQEFLYFDDEDNIATVEPVAIGNGTATLLQLTRTMGTGSIAFTEPVMAFYGDPIIYLNGVATTAFTVQEYGKVLFSSPPGVGVPITWSGIFMFVCRFSEDELSFTQMMSRLWSQDGLSMMSVKP